MDLDKRVDNLEKLVNALINIINNDKTYINADIEGVRESVGTITPYKETKAAYYKETEKTFYDVPEGNVSVLFDNYSGSYSVKRIEDRLTVSFDELSQKTNITISIM